MWTEMSGKGPEPGQGGRATVIGAPSPAPTWSPLVPAMWAVVRRPDLWRTALRQVLRLAPTGWWRRWPPLPVPAQDYLRFRTLTAYGDPNHPPKPDDVVTWLEWSKAWQSLAGGSHWQLGETALGARLTVSQTPDHPAISAASPDA